MRSALSESSKTAHSACCRRQWVAGGYSSMTAGPCVSMDYSRYLSSRAGIEIRSEPIRSRRDREPPGGHSTSLMADGDRLARLRRAGVEAGRMVVDGEREKESPSKSVTAKAGPARRASAVMRTRNTTSGTEHATALRLRSEATAAQAGSGTPQSGVSIYSNDVRLLSSIARLTSDGGSPNIGGASAPGQSRL